MISKKFNLCLDRIRAGNLNGIEPIYNEYYEKMVFIALGKVRALEIAEDIASDFIKYILEQPDKITYIEYPTAWICQSIRNRAVDYIRKDNRFMSMSEYHEIVESHDFDYELNHMIVESFKHLKESEVELVLLHFGYGLKYKEISSIINNKSVDAIKKEISRIKKKLEFLKIYL